MSGIATQVGEWCLQWILGGRFLGSRFDEMLVTVERPLTALFQIKYRQGIVFANGDIRLGLNFYGGLPGFVNIRIGQTAQFGQPGFDVFTMRIEFLALSDWIKYTKIRRRIGAATSAPLPVEAVAGQVGIHQRVPKPLRPLLPGH